MCGKNSREFSESEWEKTVSGFDSSSLYENNYRDGKYFNPWLRNNIGFIDLLSWNLSRKRKYSREERNYLPYAEAGTLQRIREEKSDYMLWLGHQSFLIQLSGKLYLLDPVLTKRALVPARKTQPALTIDEINSLDRDLTVLITHSHYDHLDADTIMGLKIRQVIVPCGLGRFISKLTDAEIIELNWWQEVLFENGVGLVSLPAQHWSNRFDVPRNTSLWCSYLISTGKGSAYLGGDSGYFHGFSEFGRKYQIRYAVMSVGAYHPRWFMHYSHMNIDESLRAFNDMNAEKFVLAHWGTFRLGDEPAGYPAIELKRKIYECNLPAENFMIPHIGQIILINL